MKTRKSKFIHDSSPQQAVWQILLPSSFHPNMGNAISSEGMLQYIKDIMPAWENKDFSLWICSLYPEDSSRDCFNLHNVPTNEH